MTDEQIKRGNEIKEMIITRENVIKILNDNDIYKMSESIDQIKFLHNGRSINIFPEEKISGKVSRIGNIEEEIKRFCIMLKLNLNNEIDLLKKQFLEL